MNAKLIKFTTIKKPFVIKQKALNMIFFTEII